MHVYVGFLAMAVDRILSGVRVFTRSRAEREGTSGRAEAVKLRTSTAVATSSNAST
jgi:hypothetical protein